MDDLVELIVEICGQQSVEVTREVLKRMNRMGLVQSLSDTSSGSKGKLCEKKPKQHYSNIKHLVCRVGSYSTSMLLFSHH